MAMAGLSAAHVQTTARVEAIDSLRSRSRMAILDELKHRGLVDGTQPVPTKNRFTPSLHRFVEPNPDVGALTIWQATVEAQETVVDEYLNRRGIYLRPPMLRCRLDHRSMVAAAQAPDGKVIAIQQTWLTGEGEKALAKRLTTGNLGAGAVRLGAVARSIGLAEGVETALSAMQMTGITVGPRSEHRGCTMSNCHPRSKRFIFSSTMTSPDARPPSERQTRIPVSGAEFICGLRQINAATGTTS